CAHRTTAYGSTRYLACAVWQDSCLILLRKADDERLGRFDEQLAGARPAAVVAFRIEPGALLARCDGVPPLVGTNADPFPAALLAAHRRIEHGLHGHLLETGKQKQQPRNPARQHKLHTT